MEHCHLSKSHLLLCESSSTSPKEQTDTRQLHARLLMQHSVTHLLLCWCLRRWRPHPANILAAASLLLLLLLLHLLLLLLLSAALVLAACALAGVAAGASGRGCAARRSHAKEVLRQ
jgi:hypothetical protein